MTRTKKRTPKSEDPILKELRLIKRLLIVSLIKGGATSEEIEYAVGGNIRDVFRMKEFKKGVLVVVENE